jgi:hypothetical protein
MSPYSLAPSRPLLQASAILSHLMKRVFLDVRVRSVPRVESLSAVSRSHSACDVVCAGTNAKAERKKISLENLLVFPA